MTSHAPLGRRATSMSRQPTPSSSSAFFTASFAANRAASRSGVVAYAASPGVNTRATNRSPNASSESAIRLTRTRSTPTRSIRLSYPFPRSAIAVSYAAAHSANCADGSNGFFEFTARAALRMNDFAPAEIVS